MKSNILQIIELVLRRFLRWINFFQSHKRVLLVCNTPLMADYLADIFEIFKNDPHLAFYVLPPLPEESQGACDYIRRKLPVSVVGWMWAGVLPWNLIIVSDHCRLPWICRFFPIIFISHGIETGKLVDGEPYTYGKWSLIDKCRPRYSTMFAASETERMRGLKQNPVLRDTIAVAGILRMDKMMTILHRRDEFRRRRGFRVDDTVVFVMSTWGPNSLFHRMGDIIVEQALRLKGKLSFIFTLHPLEHRLLSSSERNWGEYMKTFRQDGFVVLDAHEKFESSIAACDVILTDHTSAAFYGAAAGKPLVYVPLPEDCVEKGFPVWKLQKISPCIKEDASDLYEQILEAKINYPFNKLAEITLEINSCPGQAAQRIREQVYGLLDQAKGIRV